MPIFNNKNSDEFKSLLRRYERQRSSELVKSQDLESFQSIYYFACKEEAKKYNLSVLSVPDESAYNKVFQLLRDEDGIFVLYEVIPTSDGNIKYEFNCSLECTCYEVAKDFITYELRPIQSDPELTNLVDLFFTNYDD